MNWHLNRLKVGWKSIISLSVIPWVIWWSGELSHVMKSGFITVTLTPKQWLGPRQPKSPLKIWFGSKVMPCLWWNFEGAIHWEFVSNGRAVDADLNSQQLERVHEILRRKYSTLVNRNKSSFAAWQCDTPYCTNNHKKFWNWEESNCYHTQHTALILRSQITICFDPWSTSCLEEI